MAGANPLSFREGGFVKGSYQKRLQAIANDFMKSENRSATAREMARWALSNGKWKPPPSLVERRLAEELASAMRMEHINDPQGRTVRAKHAARVTRNGANLTLWDDIRSAPLSHMQVSFKQRRKQIVGDCRQLKADVDSYNENARPDRPIQMVLDFTNDVAELEALEKIESGGRAA